ncbi:hypothetical protein PHLCEN_2v11684 [Hermanssonia centrifuga]|uniref:Uncharacterized protein n=1 Tax=Hermanssonia centrifuga TaxID=98765 RepID=A0A2R6NJB6_9APHY|nr:hypothetical protein PHLCEN_2v11684 [Hermanssonia centrifuga]
MAKKRKETPPSTTLHDFFGKSGSTSVKKAKLDSSTRRPLKTKQNTSFAVAPEDIIVIESDDDEPVASRMVISKPDSDIKFVDELPPKNSITGEARPSAAQKKNSRKIAKYENYAELKVENDSAEISKTSVVPVLLGVDDLELVQFGQPSALLLRSGTPQLRPPAEEFSFGSPVLLQSHTQLRPTSETSGFQVVQDDSDEDPNDLNLIPSEKQLAYSTPPIVLDKPQVDDAKPLVPPDEEWGTGDDELEFQDVIMEADDKMTIDVDIDLTVDTDDESSGERNTETCPICSMLLEGMEKLDIQEHVNNCIDSTAQLYSPNPCTRASDVSCSAGPSAKVLRPLSSFQPPRVVPGPPLPLNPALGKEKSDGVFSVLMSSHKENEAWKEASTVEDRNFRPTKANGGRRKAPFYKVLQGMPIAVDAFRYGSIPGVTAYFLTHAHSDHYTNLSANWKNGPIYCSEGTANLIVHMLGVDRKWVHALPMDIATVIPDTGGVSVTPIEANHCPGSCLFLFEGPQTVNAGDSAYRSGFVGSGKVFRYLHCGDFRASPQHVMHPAVKGKRIDHVYLDTTYLDPKYCFPPQSQVISACAELARRIVLGEPLKGDGKKNGRVDGWFSVQDRHKEKEVSKSGKILVVVGTYSIGKERIVKAIAKALQTKVYSDARKMAILRCQSDPELDALLTSDPLEAGVHLLPLGTIASDKLKIYLERWKGHFTKAIGFRPTGWTYAQPSGSDSMPSVDSVISRSQSGSFTHSHLNPMRNSTQTLQLYGVPYSEHSSFFELTCFALSLDWGRMIATVNVGSEASRGKMAKWVEKWEAERKRRGKAEVVKFRAPDYW